MMEKYLEKFKQAASRLKETWSNMGINQKVIAGGALLFIVVAAVVLLSGGNKEEYQVLYSELSEKDAAAVVAKLNEDKIPYQLSDKGTSILVPADQKYFTRLQLAAENIPRGDAGFELFQENNFGETQTDKKVKYQWALQGELQHTIKSLEKVKDARVHIVLPEKTLFSDNEEKPSASVVITTDDNESLSSRETQGIINLISNSVEGLIAENVVIVDQNGKLISDKLSSDEEILSDVLKTQMSMKRAFEKEKQLAIQTMLDKTLGKENAVVRVSAELNFDSREETSENYRHDPDGPFIRSEHSKKESGSDVNDSDGGISGTDSNIPQYTQIDNSDGTSSYSINERTRNYEINKTETVTRYSVGDIKYDYLTVSVLVNNAISEQAKLGETEEEKISTIRNIVAAACGLRENRSDESVDLTENISVAFIDFYSEAPGEISDGITVDKLIASSFYPAIIGLLLLLVIALVFVLIRRKRRAYIKGNEEMSDFEAVVDEEINMNDLLEKNLSPEEKEKQMMKEEIDKMIEENPEGVAEVIKTWLLED